VFWYMLYHWCTAEPYCSKFNEGTELFLNIYYDYGANTYDTYCEFHEDM
jgi:hypothetical protein